ncbi:MAG: riboflavin biosynthesis protein RibF [Ruthenibacterium sp.]
MKSYETLTPLAAQNKTAVALGYFDGVHLGHRAVLCAAVKAAKTQGIASAAFTFALPETGGFKGKRILSADEKHRRIESLGIEHYIRPPFAAFCALSPEAFVRDLLQNTFGAKLVFCGADFTFGKDKAGDTALLKTLCAAADIGVCIVDTAQYQGEVISSTRIRTALAAGEIAAVNAMLGEDYCIDFPVRHGKAFGRTIGLPTLNQIYPTGMQIPKSGVYITQVQRADGSVYAGATGLGTRPTVDGEDITCETFLPDFSGDLYGERVRTRFCTYLKPTVKFSDKEQLKAYIQGAANAARAYFAASDKEREIGVDFHGML